MAKEKIDIWGGFHKDIGFKIHIMGCWNPGRWCSDEEIN